MKPSKTDLKGFDPRRLERIAVHIGEQAASAIRSATDSVAVIGTKVSSSDYVTVLDHQVEQMVRSELLMRTPDATILGEEGGKSAGVSELTWIVDPVDGTPNLVYGIPLTAVSIAGSITGQTIAGAVVDVHHHTTYSASAGNGARRDGEPIMVGTKNSLIDALIGTGMSYDPSQRAREAQLACSVFPRVGNIRSIGTAALQLVWTACGRLDGFYEYSLKPWDIAAGMLVAKEAGATVEGPSLSNAGLTVAANSALFQPLRELLILD